MTGLGRLVSAAAVAVVGGALCGALVAPPTAPDAQPRPTAPTAASVPLAPRTAPERPESVVVLQHGRVLASSEVVAVHAPRGELGVPKKLVGWFAEGPKLGQPGWVILDGHTKFGGGGVFDGLDRIRPGGTVIVNSRGYRVVATQRVPKNALAPALQRAGSGVLLITCTGARISATGQIHRDNLLIWAQPSTT